MKEISLGLIGFGTIETGVVKLLQDNDERIKERLGAKLVLKRIAGILGWGDGGDYFRRMGVRFSLPYTVGYKANLIGHWYSESFEFLLKPGKSSFLRKQESSRFNNFLGFRFSPE
ncbi:MAG: hypothetical protein Q7I93_03200 [Syntrophales bacterium]|nr:hypothetical protein [Syntrophales bacterium]